MELFSRESNPKIYDNIDDLSYFNYTKVLTEGSLSWLIREGQEATQAELVAAWVNIKRQVIEERSKDKEFIAAMEQRRKEAYLWAKAYVKRDAAKLKAIEIKKKAREANRPEPEEGLSFDIYKEFLYIEKKTGIKLDRRTTCVREYLQVNQLVTA